MPISSAVDALASKADQPIILRKMAVLMVDHIVKAVITAEPDHLQKLRVRDEIYRAVDYCIAKMSYVSIIELSRVANERPSECPKLTRAKMSPR